MGHVRAARPTLKITRHSDAGAGGQFGFEVWNPFTGRYQPTESLADGLRRVDELASLIAQMYARNHPRQAALTDAPDPKGAGGGRWAEFRVNPASHPSYDTRRSDRPAWLRSNGGKATVAEMICNSVGYDGTFV
jgi:hypothetical protein